MAITASQLTRIFPRCPDPRAWALAISEAWWRWGFLSANQQAGYLGIIGNETAGLIAARRENMAYTVERAKQVFSKARANPNVCADRIAKGPEAFASWIYAGVIGNGDEASGDGWKFRGGGIIQLTGRANYAACGEALGVNLLADPDAVCRNPEVSAAAAAWFMAKHAKILPQLDSDDEARFLEGARKVGLPPDARATTTRLAYRRAALSVLMDAGQAEPVQASVARPASAPPSPPRGSGGWLERLLAVLFKRKPS